MKREKYLVVTIAVILVLIISVILFFLVFRNPRFAGSTKIPDTMPIGNEIHSIMNLQIGEMLSCAGICRYGFLGEPGKAVGLIVDSECLADVFLYDMKGNWVATGHQSLIHTLHQEYGDYYIVVFPNNMQQQCVVTLLPQRS